MYKIYHMDTYEWTPENNNLNLGDSFLHINPTPVNLPEPNFEELWNLHPEEHGNVMMLGKLTPASRYWQSYGRSYTFAGLTHEAAEIPNEIQVYVNFANQYVRERNLWDEEYNQVLLNWYENGNDYIGPHSDNEKELLVKDGVTSVFSITFLDPNEEQNSLNRLFRIKPKNPKREGRNLSRLDVTLTDNLVLIMGGKFQKQFKHQVPKIKNKKVKRRINITLRTFK